MTIDYQIVPKTNGHKEVRIVAGGKLTDLFGELERISDTGDATEMRVIISLPCDNCNEEHEVTVIDAKGEGPMPKVRLLEMHETIIKYCCDTVIAVNTKRAIFCIKISRDQIQDYLGIISTTQ